MFCQGIATFAWIVTCRAHRHHREILNGPSSGLTRAQSDHYGVPCPLPNLYCCCPSLRLTLNFGEDLLFPLWSFAKAKLDIIVLQLMIAPRAVECCAEPEHGSNKGKGKLQSRRRTMGERRSNRRSSSR